MTIRVSMLVLVLVGSLSVAESADQPANRPPARFQLGTFSAEVTIPLNHRCMGIIPTKSKEIVDPLLAKGFVLTGGDAPLVLLALDWCEVRNGAYDRWRDVLAEAANTTRDHVLVCSLHQHDAPVSDAGVEKLLAEVGLSGEMFDPKFHEESVQRVAGALRDSLEHLQPVTHFGTGQARVEKVASNRRVVNAQGGVSFGRSSSSAGNQALSAAPDGLIDPFLKTISFWNGDKPLLALHAYATHPMSYYGRGGVTYDFVGMAREQRQRDDRHVFQIYVSGCSGDVTAGKYNDGSPAMRPLLANRMYEAMVAAWKQTTRHPLEQATFRKAELDLPFRQDAAHTAESMRSVLDNPQATVEKRILAAMGLSSLQRVQSGQKIDFPCIDFGTAQIVLFPGESFVGYQLQAQKLRPDSFVLSIGYGECWPGYIPTKAGFADNFNDVWLWVAKGADVPMQQALEQVLKLKDEG